MCNKDETTCSCYEDTLCLIVKLQKQASCIDQGTLSCDRPFLGVNSTCQVYNTRPISFYSCCNNTSWTIPYTLNGGSGTPTVFRVEAVDGCCCTCRVLAPSGDDANPYAATNNYFTINLNNVGAIRCPQDTCVQCI